MMRSGEQILQVAGDRKQLQSVLLAILIILSPFSPFVGQTDIAGAAGPKVSTAADPDHDAESAKIISEGEHLAPDNVSSQSDGLTDVSWSAESHAKLFDIYHSESYSLKTQVILNSGNSGEYRTLADVKLTDDPFRGYVNEVDEIEYSVLWKQVNAEEHQDDRFNIELEIGALGYGSQYLSWGNPPWRSYDRPLTREGWSYERIYGDCDGCGIRINARGVNLESGLFNNDKTVIADPEWEVMMQQENLKKSYEPNIRERKVNNLDGELSVSFRVSDIEKEGDGSGRVSVLINGVEVEQVSSSGTHSISLSKSEIPNRGDGIYRLSFQLLNPGSNSGPPDDNPSTAFTIDNVQITAETDGDFDNDGIQNWNDPAPNDPDRDNDGVEDGPDEAPDKPEDDDGYQDGDGVPDPDNDDDGVPDEDDDCPTTSGDGPNGCPISDPNADANGPYNVDEENSVVLDSTGSEPKGEIKEISWKVTNGPGEVRDGVYHAPDDLSEDKTATVALTVTASDDDTDTDEATININEVNDEPSAEANGPYSLEEGESITLDSSGSTDPENGIESREWEVVSGDGSITDGKYEAPESVDHKETAVVELTVTDVDGDTDTDRADVTIRDSGSDNKRPTADANGPYSVTEGASISLDSSGSNDPDGSIASTSWTVTSGPGEVIDGTYQAPSNVGGETTATVELTVTDNEGVTDSDTTEVIISPESVLSITDFVTTNAGEEAIDIRFDSSESLANIEVEIENESASVTTLTKANFSESGTGPYTYEATYTVDGSGTYEVTLLNASDAAGNDGANAESDSITILPDQDRASVGINQTYGGEEDDIVQAVVQTHDGGFALAGITRSSGAGGWDLWLVKVDSDGTEEWSQTYGGSDKDIGRDLVQTDDGGFALTGYTKSSGAGGRDFWLVKVDSEGNKEWSQTYGGSQRDDVNAFVRTEDGGYLLAGETKSFGAGHSDAWLVKTGPDGTKEWSETYGGSNFEVAFDLLKTEDGGYAFAGATKTFSAGYRDFWLVKLSSDGTKQWSKSYGGGQSESAYGFTQTDDGGYALVGWLKGDEDARLLKVGPSGDKEWSKSYGGTDADSFTSVTQRKGGGYLIGGYTMSIGPGGRDPWLVRVSADGTERWNETYGGSQREDLNDLIKTRDGGFAFGGQARSFGPGQRDGWLLKISNNGNGNERNGSLFGDSFETPDTGYNTSLWTKKSYDGGTLTGTGDGALRISSASYSFHGIKSNREFEPPVTLRFTVEEWNPAYGSAVPVGFINDSSYLDDGRSASPRKFSSDGAFATFRKASHGIRLTAQDDGEFVRMSRAKSNLNWDGQSSQRFTLTWTENRTILYMDGEVLFENTENVPSDSMPLYILGHEWTGGDATEVVVSNLSVRPNETVKPRKEDAEFTIDIIDANQPVEGESLNITVAVENVGEKRATRPIDIDVGSLGDYSAEITLDGGDSRTRTFALPTTDGDAGSYTVRVESPNSSDSTSVEVSEPPGGNATVTGDVTPGAPGENATVAFTIENNRSSAAGFILDVGDFPTNFSVAGRSDDGATWKADETKWLYQTVDAGATKSPSLTLRVPESANGTYTVSADLLDKDAVVDSVTVEFPTCRSIEDAIDENDDGEIGDFEILQAIEYWRTDESVPGTCGKTIGDFDVLELIELWRTDAQI